MRSSLRILFSPLFISTILISSCNEPSKDSFENKVVLTQDSTTIALTLDSLASQVSFNNQILGDSTICLLNSNNQSLDYYNLESGHLIKRLKPPSEGPNGIGKVNGFYIINKDSIILLNRKKYTIYLTNDSLNILKSYQLADMNIMPWISNGQHPSFFNNNLYLAGMPAGHPFRDRENYFRLPVDFKLNLVTGNMTKGQVLYPQVYLDYRVGTYFFDVFYYAKNDSLIYSFPLSDSVYMVVNNRITSHFAGLSKTYEIKELVSSELPSSEEDLDNYYDNIAYNWITYDSTSNYYYRLAELPRDPALKDKTDIFEKYSRKFSLIILDENLEKIGEFNLPDECVPRSDFFVFKGNLYLKFHSDEEDELIINRFLIDNSI